MPSNELDQKILRVEQHLKTLAEAAANNSLDLANREKLLLERTYIMLQEPYAWQFHAEELKGAADAVVERYERDELPVMTFRYMDSVYVYLMGMAIENLLKGIHVAKRPELIKLKKEPVKNKWLGYKLHDDLHWHNLTALAKQLKKRYHIDFTDDELEMIALFERFVTWAGRYQVPLDSITFVDAQFSTYYFPDGEGKPLAQGSVKTFAASFSLLYTKLDGVLGQEVKYWRTIQGFD
jgi:hypothetical protein